jgi:hypothetical protein
LLGDIEEALADDELDAAIISPLSWACLNNFCWL